MSHYLSTLCVFLGLAFVGACSNDMEKVETLAEEMCACKDQACAEKLIESAESQISNEVAERLRQENPSEFDRHVKRLVECYMPLFRGHDGPLEMPFSSKQALPEFPTSGKH